MEAPSAAVAKAALCLMLSDVSETNNIHISLDTNGPVEQCDVLLEALHLAAQQFTRNVIDYKASVGKGRNALLPISQLPLELLASIFRLAVGGVARRTTAVETLSLVCWAWSGVVRATPSLFNVLSPEDPHWRVALQRCRTAPLHIVAEERWNIPSNYTFAETVFLHRDRVRTMAVCDFSAAGPWKDFFESPPPSLRSLRAIVNSSSPPLPFLPNLQHLDIDGFLLNWSWHRTYLPLVTIKVSNVVVPSIGGLVDTIRNCPLLEIVDLLHIRVTGSDPIHRGAELPTVLSRLSHFSCYSVPSPIMTYILDCIEAPKLSRLHLEYNDQHIAPALVKRNVLPSGRSLVQTMLTLRSIKSLSVNISQTRFTIRDEGEKSTDVLNVTYWSTGGCPASCARAKLDTMKRLFEHPGTPPVNLRLYALPLDVLPDAELLQSFPSMKGLHIDRVMAAASILETLSKPSDDNGRWLCPNLETLEISRYGEASDVLPVIRRLVEARGAAGPNACSPVQLVEADESLFDLLTGRRSNGVQALPQQAMVDLPLFDDMHLQDYLNMM